MGASFTARTVDNRIPGVINVTAETATTPETLGEQYDPLGVHLDDPYPFYARAQRQTPIFFSPRANAWVVTRLRDVKKVLRDWQTYSSCNSLRPPVPLSPKVDEVLAGSSPLTGNLIELDGPEHRRHRAPSADMLCAEQVTALEPYMIEQGNALIDAFTAAGAPADFMAAYANRLPVSVVCHLVGFPPERHEEMGDLSRRAAALALGHRFESEDEQIETAHCWLRYEAMVAELLRERRAEPRADLMSRLAMGLVPGDAPLTREQEAAIVPIAFGLSLAGHITTSALLGNGLRHLLEHPEQWRLLCERPELIPTAVEEIARYDTPTHTFMRQTTRETTLAGQRLPAGADILIWLAAGNRDASVFDRADEFDLTRTLPTSHVVFGHGAHYCVGAMLARREIEVSLRMLTERLPGLRLVPDQQIRMRPSLSQRGPLSLLVTWS
jgi:cytochrome P450